MIVEKFLPYSIRIASGLDLLLFAFALILPISRPSAVILFGVFRIIAIGVACLLVAEFVVLRKGGWRLHLIDGACCMALGLVWILVRAASF
jgi:hypothetical protein